MIVKINIFFLQQNFQMGKLLKINIKNQKINYSHIKLIEKQKSYKYNKF